MGPVSSEQGAERRTGLIKQPLDLELPVVATGARPGDTSEKRELFTEATETVLVFENGCVIQLAAAVAVGQLIFLTNTQTGQEIVTQVLRKRSFRPTDCYVELEFTEPSPKFWGQEFPDGDAASKTEAPAESDATKVAESEVTEEDTNQVVAPPDAAEIERLKTEVKALKERLKALTPTESLVGMQTSASDLATLKSLLGPKAPSGEQEHEAEPPAPAEQGAGKEETQISSAKIEVMNPNEPKPEEAKAPEEATVAAPNATQVDERNPSYPIRMQLPQAGEVSARTMEFAADSAAITAAQADEHLLPKPSLDFEQFPGLAEPKTKLLSGTARRSLSGPIGVLVAVVLLLIAAVVGTYRMGWLSGLGRKHEAVESKPATTTETNAAANPNAATGNPAEPVAGSKSPLPPGPSEPVHGTPSPESKPTNVKNSAPTEPESIPEAVSVGSSSKKVESRPNKPETSGKKVPGMKAVTKDTPPSTPQEDVYVPPKLLKAIRSLSPPEALRAYVSGVVTLDTLVDETGRVQSATPTSGPKPLYERAVATVKDYVYQPATKNGKPVPAHVVVKIQFWFEP